MINIIKTVRTISLKVQNWCKSHVCVCLDMSDHMSIQCPSVKRPLQAETIITVCHWTFARLNNMSVRQ